MQVIILELTVSWEDCLDEVFERKITECKVLVNAGMVAEVGAGAFNRYPWTDPTVHWPSRQKGGEQQLATLQLEREPQDSCSSREENHGTSS